MPEEQRNLTDADVKAIVEQAVETVAQRLYGDLGRGVWDMVKKAALVAIVGFAAYGSMKGMK